MSQDPGDHLLRARLTEARSPGSGGKHRGPALFRKLLEQDEKLVAKGFPPLTKWWKDQLERFYASGKRRFVGRVGRKGIKSGTACRVAVNEVLNGAHILRPGDIGLFMFVSESMYEAKGRIFTVKAILDALGVKHEPLDRDTRVSGTALCFGVRAGRIGAVSGPVVIGFVCDEEAKWRDEDTGANPATEVISSIRPATVTQPNAHEFHISSPWSTMDAHAEMVAQGDSTEQVVAEAPTWVANPSVTEEETKRLEPDEETRLREYGAIPMGAGEVGFFDHGAIDRAAASGLVMPVIAGHGMETTVGGDLAFERDCASLAFSHRLGKWDSPVARYCLADLLEKRPLPGMPLMPGEVIGDFAEKIKEHSCNWMMADGHYRMTAIEYLQQHHLYFADAPTGQDGKAVTYVRFRVILHSDRMVIADGPLRHKLVLQLKEVTKKPTPSGGMQIRSPRKPGGGHGDLLSAAVLAVWQRSGRTADYTIQPRPGTVEHREKQIADHKEKLIRESIKRAAKVTARQALDRLRRH